MPCHGIGHISTHCLNKRTMVMHGGEIMTDSEEEEELMPPLDDLSDVDFGVFGGRRGVSDKVCFECLGEGG